MLLRAHKVVAVLQLQLLRVFIVFVVVMKTLLTCMLNLAAGAGSDSPTLVEPFYAEH
jgi:hypothetical protein